MLDHQYIKKLAADAGFDLCGLAPCRHLVENESMLRAWLGKGYQSSLAYMERNVEKRADPRKLVEGARTAVVCAVSYKNRAGEGYPPGHRTKVASYACAADYHTTIKGCSMHFAPPAPICRGGRSSTRPRCSKNNWPSKPGWAG